MTIYQDTAVSFGGLAMYKPKFVLPQKDEVVVPGKLDLKLKEFCRSFSPSPELNFYIPLSATDRYKVREFELEPVVREFLDDSTKPMGVRLLWGQASSGKSLFLQYLTVMLSEAYLNDKSSLLPLFINLPTVPTLKGDLIEAMLQRHRFSEAEVKFLKEQAAAGEKRFVFILDSYDEAREFESYKQQGKQPPGDINLWATNHLEKWNSKVIISCRTTAFSNPNEARVFFLPLINRQLREDLFDERHLVPFSPTKRDDYIIKYIPTYLQGCLSELLAEKDVQADQQTPGILSNLRTAVTDKRLKESKNWAPFLDTLENEIKTSIPLQKAWENLKAREKNRLSQQWLSVAQFNHYIEGLNGFRETLVTPFLVKIAITILPDIAEKLEAQLQRKERVRIVPLDLYEELVESFFNRQRDKLVANGVPIRPNIRKSFENFSIALAKKMEEKGISIVEYEDESDFMSPTAEPNEWARFFSTADANLVTVREGCPLIHEGNTWLFWHDTIKLYFINKDMINRLLKEGPSPAPQSEPARSLLASP